MDNAQRNQLAASLRTRIYILLDHIFRTIKGRGTVLVGIPRHSSFDQHAAYWVNSFKVRRATLDTKKAVLSDPQYRTILHAIENRDGANVYTSRTKVRQRSLSTIAIPKRGKSSSEIWKRLGLQEGIAVECRAETGDEDDQVRLDVRLVANEASSPVKNEGKDQENFTLKSSIEGAKFPSGNVLMLQFIGSQHSVVVCVRATMLNVDGNPIIRDLKKDTDVWISSRPAELISRWPMTR